MASSQARDGMYLTWIKKNGAISPITRQDDKKLRTHP